MNSLDKEFKNLINASRPKTCLGSSFLSNTKCSELISPHSIQNNKILNFIAEGSQTLLHRRFLESESRQTELILFEKLGRNQATTFSGGMCGNHDRLLFDSIEQQKIDPSNRKQLLVFAIRSCLKEIYTKMYALNIVGNITAETTPLHIGYQQANDSLEKIKGKLRKVFIQNKREYKDFETSVFALDGVYKIACSAVISPWFGYCGEVLNSTEEAKPEVENTLFVNVYPDKENLKTYIMLGFFRENRDTFRKTIKYLKSLKRGDLEIAISALLICYCQNFVITETILSDKELVRNINQITTETTLPFAREPQDIYNPFYLTEIMKRQINLFTDLTK